MKSRLVPSLAKRLPASPMSAAKVPLVRMRQPTYRDLNPTWREARPGRIAASLRQSQSQNSGGWFVAGQTDDLTSGLSRTRWIAGREVVLWRDHHGDLLAGPGACPHLGALLDRCPVLDDKVVCRWHGLSLGKNGHGTWQTYRAIDDGVLLWVRLPTPGETETSTPEVAGRPPLTESVAAVVTKLGRCEPEDVIANRLDPWHGGWFHPYAFSHLLVDDHESTKQRLVVDVAFRVNRSWGVPVRAEFISPDARTVVMRIIEGEGIGSVVETHATPLTQAGADEPQTMITETTIAHSARSGFALARQLAPFLRPGMRHVARRLWVDDLAYAERRYALRRIGEFPG